MNGEKGTFLRTVSLAASHVGLAALAAVAGYIAGRAAVGEAETAGGSVEIEARGAVAVRTTRAERTMLERVIRLTGTVAPQEKVAVVPRLGGRIVELNVEEGSTVRRGKTVLAVIEHADLEAQKRAAQAAVGVARAQLSQAEVNLAQARKGLARALALHAEGGASDEMLEHAQAGVDSLVAQKSVVEKQIGQLEANLDLVKLRIEDARIVSPADGVVTDLHGFDVGDTVAPGMPFCEIAGLAELKALLIATEDHLAALKGKEEVRVRVPALDGRIFPGTVDKLPQSLDARTRTGAVEVGVKNENGALRPGMFVSASLVIEKREGALTVPDSALVSRTGKVVAYVVLDGQAKEKEVKPGLRTSGRVEILDGLAEGDEVVTGGAKMLSEGTSVKVVER